MIFLLFAGASCADATKDPARVSDKFVDLYFLELDLEGASALTDGPAKTRVERDLALAKQTRETTSVEGRRPSVYYDKPTRQHAEGDLLHSTYRLDIKSGSAELTRDVVVIAARRGERFKVIEFREADQGGSGGAPGIGVRTSTAAE